MVEQTPDLREAFGLEARANAITRVEVGGSFKPINAKASTQDGLNPSHTVLDEVHAHKTHDLLNVLQSAAGARANPLWLYTTTEGYETPGPWPELRHFARQVLEGVIEADHFLALYYAVDEKDDDFDEAAWPKANPLMDVNPLLLAEIRKAAIEAKAMPGRRGIPHQAAESAKRGGGVLGRSSKVEGVRRADRPRVAVETSLLGRIGPCEHAGSDRVPAGVADRRQALHLRDALGAVGSRGAANRARDGALRRVDRAG
jgi:hypothetical protein